MALCAQRQRVVQRRAIRQSKPAAYKGKADGCVCEAEELLEVRTREDGVREFLVKWRDRGAGANSWEPEHEFITSHLIEKLLARGVSAEPPQHAQRADDRTEGRRNEPTTTTAANPQATSPHSGMASEDEAPVNVEDDTHHHIGGSSSRSGGKPFSESPRKRRMGKPAAKRRLQLDSSAPRAPAKKDKPAVHDDPHTDNETGFSPTSSSPRADNAAADSASSENPGVLISSSLAARLVEMDDFEDVMIDCFVWRLFKKSDTAALGTVVDFIRRPDLEYAFAGRWTDIHMLVRGTDGNVRPMRFIDLADNPLTQEHIHHYRTAMLDHADSSGKWSEEWTAAKSRQLAEFLKH